MYVVQRMWGLIKTERYLGICSLGSFFNLIWKIKNVLFSSREHRPVIIFKDKHCSNDKWSLFF